MGYRTATHHCIDSVLYSVPFTTHKGADVVADKRQHVVYLDTMELLM